MANYNTFAVVQSKHGKVLLITSSARKASALFGTGNRIEVWNDNTRIESITYKFKNRLLPFLQAEKEYIQKKQEAATNYNARKRRKK